MTYSHRERWLQAGPVGVGLSLPAGADHRIGRLVKPFVRKGRVAAKPSPTSDGHPDTWRDHLAGWKQQDLSSDPEVRALQEQVAAIDWYHAIDLGRGVVTPGKVDHRVQLPLYRLPESLKGMRCLDVASMDGFWAFEMERRGAAEVVAIDVARRIDVDMPYAERQKVDPTENFPVSGGFEFARNALGSRVKKLPLSVYDLSPEKVGEFDFIFLSDLLLHLRDPQLALESVRSVCRGVVHLADVCDPDLEAFGDRCVAEYPLWATGKFFYWWRLNVNTIRRMLHVAGFAQIEELSRLRLNLIQASNRDAPLKVVLQATVKPVNAVPAPIPNGAHMVAPPSRLRRHRWARLGSIGIGIALPINTEKRIAPLLRDDPAASREPQAALPPDIVTPLPSRRPEPSQLDREARVLVDRVTEIDWHDVIELGHGVVTPGVVDRRREIAKLPLPAALGGKRCLDASTHDGFWAFELERRGASEVVAIRGARAAGTAMSRGFRLAKDLLGSRVEGLPISVYDLSPEIHGHFDIVVVDDLLGHVHDPQLALDRIRAVSRGAIVLIERSHKGLEPYGGASLAEYRRRSQADDEWWLLSRNAIRRMVALAAFADIQEVARISGPTPLVVLTATVEEARREPAPRMASPAGA